jgi:hypothetical protein
VGVGAAGWSGLCLQSVDSGFSFISDLLVTLYLLTASLWQYRLSRATAFYASHSWDATSWQLLLRPPRRRRFRHPRQYRWCQHSFSNRVSRASRVLRPWTSSCGRTFWRPSWARARRRWPCARRRGSCACSAIGQLRLRGSGAWRVGRPNSLCGTHPHHGRRRGI